MMSEKKMGSRGMKIANKAIQVSKTARGSFQHIPLA